MKDRGGLGSPGAYRYRNTSLLTPDVSPDRHSPNILRAPLLSEDSAAATLDAGRDGSGSAQASVHGFSPGWYGLIQCAPPAAVSDGHASSTSKAPATSNADATRTAAQARVNDPFTAPRSDGRWRRDALLARFRKAQGNLHRSASDRAALKRPSSRYTAARVATLRKLQARHAAAKPTPQTPLAVKPVTAPTA